MRILLVGDTHGNTRWWKHHVVPAAVAAGADAVVQLGDFGYWDDASFVGVVASSPLPVFFVDGNHEHHELLRSRICDRDLSRPVHLSGALHYLPRASVAEWGGVRFMALGGAASIDRARRTPGVSWFAEETLSDDDLTQACAQRATIVVAHDAPDSAPVPLSPRELLPEHWKQELPRCEEHRRRLQDVLDRVQPEVWVHGHYHVAYEQQVGTCRFVGLSCDGTGEANLRMLDVHDGVWEFLEL